MALTASEPLCCSRAHTVPCAGALVTLIITMTQRSDRNSLQKEELIGAHCFRGQGTPSKEAMMGVTQQQTVVDSHTMAHLEKNDSSPYFFQPGPTS